MTTTSPTGPVLLFDGECGLCNRVVRRLLALDRAGQLRFAPLQGPSAQAYLRARGLPTADFSTLVLVPDWPANAAAPLLRTDGVIAALRAVGRPGWASLLAVSPRFVRDAGYKFVARVRSAVFGPWRTCPLPRSEWTARFID
ncbi:MAG: putative thiol-disulfide oxidoreductase YuxK [Verrucomicrobia bacterium]|nr:MAG: putative thiol-disulfide oxidoreductase YuxK [Verrucomicrobiota bacterium]